MTPETLRSEKVDDLLPRSSELVRANERLREQLKALREEAARLRGDLQDKVAGIQSDRLTRLATLNMLEDTVAARNAEKLEIRERRRVEQELRETNRRKDEFLATLAHELRNPLAPIRNNLQVLRRTASASDPNRGLLDMMDRHVSLISRLVDDLLEVARINEGKIDLRMEPLALADVVESAVELSRPFLQAGRRRFEMDLPDEPILVHADSVRLSQLIANLLNNAAKYTGTDGHVRLRAVCEDKEVVISIRDDGIGISRELLPGIFDLFSQGDRRYSGVRDGLGIGLTLARRVAELHGGTIDARSDGPGRGSEFRVRLPRVLDPVASPPKKSRPERSAPLAARAILVVDDNHDSATSMAMLLRTLGCQVETAGDGLSALAAISKHRPEVVLLDIGMPGMDGIEVARRVRAEAWGRDITLIALTGWGQEEDRKRTAESGFDHHLLKPVDFQKLEELLSDLPVAARSSTGEA